MRLNVPVLFALVFGLLSCMHVDVEKEKQHLLAAYKEERKARILGDFNHFKTIQAEDFTYIHDGIVQHITAQQTKDSLQKFFKTAQYDNWDDMEPPVINMSSDGTMASIISKIYVRRSMQNKQGTITQEEFTYAGLSAYKKSDGKWLKIAQSWTVTDHVNN